LASWSWSWRSSASSACAEEPTMSPFTIIGIVVVVMFVLGYLGLR
jgi:hypothetical protein